MPVEFIGWIAPRVSSEIIDGEGPVFSLDVIKQTAQVHEKADFDRVLIGYFSNAPDGFMLGAHASAHTDRLGFLLAHRPGFVAPTVAARKLATFDQLTEGRVAVHIISGGSPVDQARDGDYEDHGGRYRRSAEYVDILKRVWTSSAPFDYEGEFYKFEGAHTEIYCHRSPHIPVYGGGGSDDAINTLSPCIDTFMLWGEPLAATSAFMQRVRTAAVHNPIEFSLSTRPILADTEGKAWDRARDILKRIQERLPNGGATPQNVGSLRLLDAAAEKEVHDTCLYTALAAATGARGNSTALVGTPDNVAEALARYYDIGAKTLLVRGYDPLPDAIQYGEELIPRVRALVAERDAAAD
ncbi:MAG: alkanesulfonate monooxygenase [Gammaproteobacteria bacterium]|nr:alkanesulfonate monooxygenase [Gammaproteobacteria bacterium]|tara:strand:+ start:1084 stop:2145 length:1062 start_codon:yes stop_codon:yes gene_type:complete